MSVSEGEPLSPKRILQVHCRYVWSPGGEIYVLEQEAELLRSKGHEVSQFFVDNPAEEVSGFAEKAKMARDIVWSKSALESVRAEIRRFRPDLVHVHNFFVRLSPSVYRACNLEGVPVVQTLHNYRTCCAAANLLRNGVPCQDCVGRFPFPALRHKCYRGSLATTLPLVGMQVWNRWNRAFTEMVDGYICLSGFAKEIFVRSGLPSDKLHVKPNFSLDHGASELERKNQIVFVGRLEEEKGPHVLVDAWLKARPAGWTCHLLGEGQMRQDLERRCAGCDSIFFHGWLEKEQVERFIKESKYVAMSSVCYEGFPLALAEALSFGTPAIVPDHGAMPEIMEVPKIGFVFRATDPISMAEVITNACAVTPEDYSSRSVAARKRFLQNYTPDQNYAMLLDIYGYAAGNSEKRGRS